MHPTKRLSIKSATVAGIVASSLLGLAGITSIQRQPRRSCTASTLNIRPAALPAQASCLGLVRWHALRCVITLVAMQTAASIALECGGKGFFRRVASEKKAVAASSRWRLFYRSRAEDRRPTAAASQHEAHLVCHF